MNTNVLASKYKFDINNLRLTTSAIYALFRKKFWASNVMYRGLAAGILVE